MSSDGSTTDAGGATEAAPGGMDGIAAAIGDFLATMPEWATIAIAAVAAAFFGTLVGSRLGRGRTPIEDERHAPVLTSPGEAADAGAANRENPALKSLQKILEARGVGAKDQDTRIREFATLFTELRRKLEDMSPGSEHLKPLVRGALDSLESGHFQRTIEFMEKVASSDGKAGRELKQQAERHLIAATAKVVAGDLMMAQTETEQAKELYRDAVEMVPPLAEDLLAEFLNKYGTAAYQSGDHDTATLAFERALRHLERTLGEDHADVATALNNLALLYYSRGNYDRAEPLYRRALAIDEKILGADDTGVATDLNNLALLYKKMGDLESAEPLLKRALEIKEKNFDPGHPSLVTGLKNYASLLRALDRGEEARELEQRAASLPPKRTEAAE